MDLESYKRQKKERALEKEQEERKHRDWCFKCFRPKKNCLCSEVTSFDPEMKVILLMHPMEAKRERIGTGRLTHLCLENSEIIVDVDFTNNTRVQSLLSNDRYYPLVLYPGESAVNISEGPMDTSKIEGKELLLFVIDGTWPCAKKMMKLSSNINSLPRICFTPTTRSRFDVKFQPDEMCLSTIESIHFFLREWERMGHASYDGKHQGLINIFDEMVAFQKRCALDPNLPSYRKGHYKEYHEKIKSKKWEDRKLFFD